MFKPVVSDEPRRDGVTKAMVDDDNTTISFLGRGRSGEWNFEYFDPSIDFRFRFAASRNDEESPTAPAKDYWRVGLSTWSLVPAVVSHSDLDPDEFESRVRSKISDALLNWPLDRNANTLKAKSVSYYKLSVGHSLKECVAIALSSRQHNG
jgi:hypothetical protein